MTIPVASVVPENEQIQEDIPYADAVIPSPVTPVPPRTPRRRIIKLCPTCCWIGVIFAAMIIFLIIVIGFPLILSITKAEVTNKTVAS